MFHEMKGKRQNINICMLISKIRPTILGSDKLRLESTACMENCKGIGLIYIDKLLTKVKGNCE